MVYRELRLLLFSLREFTYFSHSEDFLIIFYFHCHSSVFRRYFNYRTPFSRFHNNYAGAWISRNYVL
jgi:hypothetical protein